MEWKQQFLNDHNQIRKIQRLSNLQWCPQLQLLAEKQISQISRIKKIEHGHLPTKGLQNIASGKKNLLKDDVVVKLWCSDEGHRKPIVNSTFTKLGASYSIDENNNVIIVCNYA